MPETVKRRPPRSARGRDTRADARRRARRIEEESVRDESPARSTASTAATAGPQPSLLRRLLLPPAAPLPDKPDPLANFRHTGPGWLARPAAAIYLLRAQPLVWLAAGFLWAVARILEPQPNAIGVTASLVAFGALIGAGYLGWQRPWLYGLAAGLVGMVFLAAFAFAQALSAGEDPGATGLAVVQYFLAYAIFFGAMATLAGWFGGYWRRRLAEAKAQAQRDQARRRRS